MSTTTEIIDDIDGSRPARAVSFSLDGTTYRIDLSAEHEDELRYILTRYIAHARPLVRRNSVPLRRDDAWSVRRWAFDQGYEVPTRGRLGSYWFKLYDAQKTLVPPGKRW